MTQTFETTTLAGGCFWCLEAVFRQLAGVEQVVSGFMNGHLENPSYKAVCNGDTGHAEVIQITFAPEVISFQTLLQVFFASHDPTTLNRQGNDVGTQYRSGIYFHTPEQQKIAQSVIAELDAAKLWSRPIVTEVVPARIFYPAEDYHQDYFANNQMQPYCQLVIRPKVEKIQKLSLMNKDS